MVRRMICGSAIAIALCVVGGCKCPTYYTQKVNCDACFSGAPALVYKPAICIVTWEKEENGKKTTSTTQHYCKIPVLYSVDVYKAPFGKTTAAFSMNDDGQLTSTNAILDQEVPEIINAAGNLIKDAFPSGIRGNTVQTFQPGIDTVTGRGDIVSMQFQEILIE